MASYNTSNASGMGEPPRVVLECRQGQQYTVRVRDVVVHEFKLGDVDDPEIYAGFQIHEWQSSESGQWVMGVALEPPHWRRVHDLYEFSYRYQIVARLREPDEMFFRLKFA
jgi:hypothetical protein